MTEEVKAGDLIAVYGTLRGGRMPNTKYVGKGTVKGRLLHLGGFPGLVHTNEDKEVVVEVYSIDSASLVTDHLDHYEGYYAEKDEGMYLRRQLPVRFVAEGGEGDEHHADLENVRDAWIYLWNRDQNRPEIATGDWFNRGET